MNIDPPEVGPKPLFREQGQAHSRTVKKLDSPSDHGEESSVGIGKLEDYAAIAAAPLNSSTPPPEKVEKWFGENTVFKRAAQPVELAELFVFSASNDASYVPGEVFSATGGRAPY